MKKSKKMSAPPFVQLHYAINREEIISILQDVYNISGSSEDSVLGHYLEHLENHYPQWFPVSLLTDIIIDREYEPAIGKRILCLIKNCCENENDAERYSGRYIIPIEYDFCTEAQLSMDYESKRLMITIWSGDTKWQGFCLFNKTTNDLSWVYDDSLTVDGLKLAIETAPYLRLAHFQSTVIAEYFDREYYRKNFGVNKDKCIDLYNDITKEWKKPDWPQFNSLLKGKYKGMIDMSSFEPKFKSKFENSNRNYAHVSFGYETTVFLPLDVISKYERNNSTLRGNDKLASFISRVIDQLMNRIK